MEYISQLCYSLFSSDLLKEKEILQSARNNEKMTSGAYGGVSYLYILPLCR